MNPIIKEEKNENTVINTEILDNYLAQMILLLNEILDETIPFKEKV